jgi:hypothetical protein
LDQPGLLARRGAVGRVGLTAIVAAVSVGVAACGGGGGGATTSAGPPEQPPFTDNRDGLVTPSPALGSANRQPRGESVTYNDPPPPISAGVKAAAETAGCTVKSWPSEPDPSSHMTGEAKTTISVPPLSGAHNPRWSDWGVYNQPIPYKYQLHNLEHGGVVIHYGTQVPVAGVNALRNLWATSPAYLIVVPDSNVKFPVDAVVAGSQQRWLVCKPFKPEQVSAVDAFLKEYRGRGPEQIPAKNTGSPRPGDQPAPVLPDKGA